MCLYERLIELWTQQGIEIVPVKEGDLNEVNLSKRLNLPEDFRNYYKSVNGMSNYTFDDTDENGFLFYEIKEISKFKDTEIYVFAEFMHASWLYGFKNNSKGYDIFLVLSDKNFIRITSSLDEFIEWYLIDSINLYPK